MVEEFLIAETHTELVLHELLNRGFRLIGESHLIQGQLAALHNVLQHQVVSLSCGIVQIVSSSLRSRCYLLSGNVLAEAWHLRLWTVRLDSCNKRTGCSLYGFFAAPLRGCGCWCSGLTEDSSCRVPTIRRTWYRLMFFILLELEHAVSYFVMVENEFWDFLDLYLSLIDDGTCLLDAFIGSNPNYRLGKIGR